MTFLLVQPCFGYLTEKRSSAGEGASSGSGAGLLEAVQVLTEECVTLCNKYGGMIFYLVFYVPFKFWEVMNRTIKVSLMYYVI